MGGVRRQRRELRNLLPYEDQMMSYPTTQGGGGVNDLYYQSDDWRGRGLDQALQRLVERDQRREQEEQQREGWIYSTNHVAALYKKTLGFFLTCSDFY